MLTNQRGTLICIGGLPAVGKTTLADELLRKLGSKAIEINPDPIMKHLRGGDGPITSEDLNNDPSLVGRAIDRMKNDTEEALAQGLTVIVASAFIREKMRNDFEELAGKTDAKFCPFWLDAPLPVLYERSEKRIQASQAGVSNNASAVGRDKINEGDKNKGNIQWPLINANREPELVLKSVSKGLDLPDKYWQAIQEERKKKPTASFLGPR